MNNFKDCQISYVNFEGKFDWFTLNFQILIDLIHRKKKTLILAKEILKIRKTVPHCSVDNENAYSRKQPRERNSKYNC